MGKITEKNTKATIFKALKEAEKKIEELEKGKLDAEAEVTAKKKTETKQKADQIMEGNVEDQITNLSKSIASLLGKVGEDITRETSNLQTVKEAIQIKETELKELYDIERQAHTLAGLVNAHQELKLAQEQELADAKEKASAELAEIEEKIQTAREEYEQQVKEQKEKLAQSQKRTEEEFAYNFAREKKQSYDSLQDELERKRKAFDTEVEEKNKELSEYNRSLAEREDAIKKREEKMDELEAKVEAIPTRIEEVKKEADEKAKAEIKRKVAIREATFKKEIEADKRILETECAHLKEQLASTNEAMENIQAKLDEAYHRIQQMGIQMVSSSNESKAFDKIANLVSEKNQK